MHLVVDGEALAIARQFSQPDYDHGNNILVEAAARRASTVPNRDIFISAKVLYEEHTYPTQA